MEFPSNAQDLNSGQIELLRKINKFLNNQENCFIITGAAGTGKTYITKLIAEMLNLNNRKFRLAAPTGRAAKVLSYATNCRATTIHKMIYSQDHIEVFDDLFEEYKKIVLKFNINTNDDPNNTVYIFDESSMISDQESNDEELQFGSGRLLHDILKYTDIGFKGSLRKLIFIGDKYQLPPVNSNKSEALESSYLQEKYGIKCDSFALEEIVRQESISGILKNAAELRLAMTKNSFNQLEILPSHDVILERNPSKIIENYCQELFHANYAEKSIIITYRNVTALEYNKCIKEKINTNDSLFLNDRIIVIKNTYTNGIELLNGEIGYIEKFNSPIESRSIHFKSKSSESGKRIIDLYFQDVVINFENESISKRISCKVLLNLLDSSSPRASEYLTRALIVDFKKRNEQTKETDPRYPLILKHDIYFNAVQIKYAYAITCHKAQGGEWDNVYVDFSTPCSKNNLNYFKWVYTAITRCKEKLTCLNTPGFNILSKMQIRLDKSIVVESQPDLQIQLASIFYEASSIEDVVIYLASLNNHHVRRFVNIQFGFTIELFDLQNDVRAQINIFHDKENTISKIHRLNEVNTDIINTDYLNALIGFSIDNLESSFEFSKDSTIDDTSYKLYLEVGDRLKQANIYIKDIVHNPWSDSYFVIQNCRVMKINITYNKKGIITNIFSSSKSITPELYELLQKLKGSE